MKEFRVSRRAVMMGAASLPLIQKVAAQARPKTIVISSANRNNGGMNCCAKAVEVIQGGGDTLDAVIAGVNIVELDPRDNSVGYGGLPNEEGVVELDASCMHGPTRRGGAVGALRNIKTPSKVAKAVMEQTDHMFLVGEGALKFARIMGFKEDDLLTEESRIQWLVWKKSLRDGNNHNNWGPGIDTPPAKRKAALDLEELKREFPNAGEELLLEAIRNAAHPPHGTINCIALNAQAEMSAVTTTSGMAWKIPGRVGDSPIIGGGLWLDQDIGGAGSTGRGEENIRACGAHTVVENLRHGMSPKEAALDALKRVVRNFDNDMDRLAQVDLQFYALRKDGEYAGATLWGPHSGRAPAQFAVCTSDRASHHEDCAYLLEAR
ncbi:MAG TPA: N(4)-(beta-N-acetylglucosaminyl)-L-asparaginase [Candidatus Acidoferrales bacterium]|nr:N(4)-(beta-N-acetylglucosaminyl)-L-asparaginase [Candidatus Acidoferrales bacterium]